MFEKVTKITGCSLFVKDNFNETQDTAHFLGFGNFVAVWLISQ
jgi:hypothetical protein